LATYFHSHSIDYRRKKLGFKTCAILFLVNSTDTGTEPNEDRKY
jgi:hypothetical protein